MERAKRRMDHPTLSSIDSSGPEESPAPWDTETDHLLSYFLGDMGGAHGGSHGGASIQQDFASSGGGGSLHVGFTGPLHEHHAHAPPSASAHGTVGHAVPPVPHYASAPHSFQRHPPQPQGISGPGDDHHQPRTPAIQYYHSAPLSSSQSRHAYFPNHSNENNMSVVQSTSMNSSSCSPLSSIPTLVSGGPLVHHHQQMQQAHRKRNSQSNNPSPLEGASPISPAGMMGTPQENLMLPPESRTPPTPAAGPPMTAIDHKTNQNSNKEDHLAWLKQINAMAKAATQQGTIVPPPAGMPMHHHPPQHQPLPVQPQHPVPTQQTATQHPAAPTTTATHLNTAQPAPAMMQGYTTTAGFPPHHPGPLQAPVIYSQAALSQMHQKVAQTAGETEEKRARRLERNRESARKSRRRKKERLATLEKKVDHLHTQIEEERRKQINSMLTSLNQRRIEEIANLGKKNHDSNNSKDAAADDLAKTLKPTGTWNGVSEPVIEFQYSALKQFLLPRYQNFLVWLTLHPESYFTAGKEEFARREGKQIIRVSSSRVSSKQIGDDLTNGWKKNETSGKGKEDNSADTPDVGERSNPTSRALEAARMWPLLCFELSISVDQEERILNTLKKTQQMKDLPQHRSQLAAATKMTGSLREAVVSQCRVAAAREQRTLLNILTPSQVLAYKEWLAANKERCDNVRNRHRTAKGKDSSVWKETSLFDVCKRLEQVLRLPKNDSDI